MKTTYLDFRKHYNKNNITHAGNALKRGELVIFPTDTVYGLGTVYDNKEAIYKIFDVKNRDLNKPLNVLISDISMLNLLAKNVSEAELKLMSAFWPGPLTIILEKEETVLDIITSNLNTIGVRIPNNKIALDLINYVGKPIVTTSANISGNLSLTDATCALDVFNNKVSYVLDGGESKLKLASTIVCIKENKPIILRNGSISLNDINSVLNV